MYLKWVKTVWIKMEQETNFSAWDCSGFLRLFFVVSNEQNLNIKTLFITCLYAQIWKVTVFLHKLLSLYHELTQPFRLEL